LKAKPTNVATESSHGVSTAPPHQFGPPIESQGKIAKRSTFFCGRQQSPYVVMIHWKRRSRMSLTPEEIEALKQDERERWRETLTPLTQGTPAWHKACELLSDTWLSPSEILAQLGQASTALN
jgi:hypothetical protein